jgi:hypothetical protein
MTSDTSGPTSSAPYATWDLDLSCWKTSATTSLWALPMSSVTLPAWGGLLNGELYELLTPELHTTEHGFLLLRTPTAQLATNGGSQHPDKRKAGGHGPTLADEVEHLLPTPTAQHSSGGYNPAWGHGVTLADATRELARLNGETLPALYDAGKTSWDDPHPALLSRDEVALPA